jgi:hypothetical protein
VWNKQTKSASRELWPHTMENIEPTELVKKSHLKKHKRKKQQENNTNNDISSNSRDGDII